MNWWCKSNAEVQWMLSCSNLPNHFGMVCRGKGCVFRQIHASPKIVNNGRRQQCLGYDTGCKYGNRLIIKAKSSCFLVTLRCFVFGKASYTVCHKQDKVRGSLDTLKHPSLTYKAISEAFDTFFRLCQAVNYPRPIFFWWRWSIIWFADTRMHVCASHWNTALGCQLFIISCSWLKCVRQM